MTHYRTIVVDPPWHYGARNGYATPLGNAKGNTASYNARQAMPYPTLTVEEIAALPVPTMAEYDAHLYLWVTQRYLFDARLIVRGWGFEPGAVLVWCKKPKGVVGTYVCSTEFVVFARRGSLPAQHKQLGTWFQWPRSAHSAKPDAFIDMVERVSPGPYAELFARRARFGWDYPIGDQALGGSNVVDARQVWGYCSSDRGVNPDERVPWWQK